MKQDIININLKNPNNNYVIDCPNGENCFANNRAVVTQPDLYNLQISLQNSTLADTGIYKVIVEVSSVSAVEFTSTVSISITSAGE